jgi:energy-coupling factor transporter ATP-binding protein EcfA2/energy-coupling factor transporter transmembrane protein EcfT
MIRLEAAGWRFPSAREAQGGPGSQEVAQTLPPSIGPVDLVVNDGEFVVLTGPTGCGKSTVLRLAAGLLQRHGRGQASGAVRVGGRDPATLVAGERVRTLGFVGQDPDDGVVCATCDAEVAFALESAGAGAEEIAARVPELLARVGLAGMGPRAPYALSGGQRQRLVIAAALSAGARVLLLDEPLSQLDPDGAREVLTLLRGLADEGVAVLCVEHRLELAMPLATRTVLMDAGRIVADPLRSTRELRERGLHGPALDELRGLTGGARWRVRGGGDERHAVAPAATTSAPAAPPAPLLTANALNFAWPGGPRVIRDVSFTVSAGERVAIIGGNGAGKSTLIGLLAGRLTPQSGAVQVAAAAPGCIEVPQNPDLALFCASVAEELAHGPTEHHVADVGGRVAAAAAALSITELFERPPQALSRGQRLRTAVAAAVACRPAVLVLDEPTSGQDRDQVDRMLTALSERRDGCLIFASHDLDVVLRHATRVVVMVCGSIVADGPPLATVARSGLALPPLADLCFALGVPYGAPEEVARLVTADAGLPVPDPPPSPAKTLRPNTDNLESPPTPSGDPLRQPGFALGAPGAPDPRATVGIVFLLGVLVLCLDGAAPLALLAGVGTLAVLVHPRAVGWRLRFCGMVALLAWTTAFSQGLFWNQWPRTPLVVLTRDPMIALYREGLVHGAVQSLRFTAVTAAGVWVALTTSPDRLVTGMLALRIPFGVALMGSTALRFLPMVGAELLAVRGARARRGRPVWKRSPWAWMVLEVSLLRPVVARALRRARTLAESLETRGFHPTAPRAVREPLRMRAGEGVAVALAGITALSAVIARGLYAAYGAELYYAPSLRTLYAFVRAWM